MILSVALWETSNFQNKSIIIKYSYFITKMFFFCFEKLHLMISAIKNFIFQIRNGRIVENISREKISHDL